MHVMILGAAGMLGQKLADRLATLGQIGGVAVDRLTLADVVPARVAPGSAIATDIIVSDLAVPGEAARLVGRRPDVIFHLAAIVSGQAEADFTRGYTVNLEGTMSLFEAIRLEGLANPYCPKLVFTSSIAVFGAPYPDVIGDDFHLTPLTSYGTQKAIGELLLADYSRRGFMDGIGLRLPTICIRPGRPNQAASSFFSGILREPLNGQQAILPVSPDVRHWFASPRAAVGFLIHAAGLDLAKLGARRSLTMPGLSATVADEIEALRQFAGEDAVQLIRVMADPTITRIVSGWPQSFDAARATALGFQAETSFDQIIRTYADEELGGRAGAG